MDLLDFIPRARTSDPATSHAAAAEIAASGTGKAQRDLCVRAILAWPGRTTAELAALMEQHDYPVGGSVRHMVARRCPEARALGLVTSGNPRKCGITRKTALTWRAV